MKTFTIAVGFDTRTYVDVEIQAESHYDAIERADYHFLSSQIEGDNFTILDVTDVDGVREDYHEDVYPPWFEYSVFDADRLRKLAEAIDPSAHFEAKRFYDFCMSEIERLEKLYTQHPMEDTMKRGIGDQVLDTRYVNQMIEDLEDGISEELFKDYFDNTLTEEEFRERHGDPDDYEVEELKALRDFRDELEGYCDWNNGETLIEADYREIYAEELAEDIGAINRHATWPLQHIDWKAAAADLFRYDYTSADIQGYTYYVRVC